MRMFSPCAVFGAFTAVACQSQPARAPRVTLDEPSGLAHVTILARGME